MTDDAPVLFLDIDEVLVNARARCSGIGQVDPVATGILRRILQETGARIVVISTWRSSHSNCAAMFDDHGLTPHLWSPIGDPADDWRVDADNASRSGTIVRWLAAHPGVRRWIIVDDSQSDLVPDQLQRLVQADMTYGLGPREYWRAVRLLHGRPKDARAMRDEDTDPQTPRRTLANIAALALAALDQGDDDGVRHLLDIIRNDTLAQ